MSGVPIPPPPKGARWGAKENDVNKPIPCDTCSRCGCEVHYGENNCSNCGEPLDEMYLNREWMCEQEAE